MSILGEVLRELVGMFIADLRMTLSVLALVGLVGLATGPMGVAPLIGGAVLALGCLMLLVGFVAAAGRRAR